MSIHAVPAARTARLRTHNVLILGLLLPLSTLAEPLPQGATENPPKEEAQSAGFSPVGSWFLTLGAINSYPNLYETEEIARQSIDLPFHIVSPWFGRVRTFSDLRDDGYIWTPYLGFGKVLSRKWMVLANMGMSGTTAKSHGRSPSVLVLPLRYDVRFHRTNFLIGISALYYPWNMPDMPVRATLGQRLKCARPFLGVGVNYNRIDANTRVDAGIGPLNPIVKVRQYDLWESASLALAAGLTIPVSRSSVLSITGQHVTFSKDAEDFTGPGINISYRHFFGRKQRHQTASPDNRS